MKVTIEIIDRIYKQIKEMVEFNGITVEQYALDCVLDNFNIMKYGDLNEKLHPSEVPKIEATKVPTVEENKIEEKPIEEKPKRKVGRPRKVKAEEENKVIHPSQDKADIQQTNVVKEEKQAEVKIKKTTRILKTK